ncbi:MAG: ABC transporter substrate-binding protein [SAR324 cluster bacterium]
MLRKSILGLSVAALAAALLALLTAPALHAQEAKPVKVGIVTFLSGPASGPFGIPARNAAELLVEAINTGTLPAPYSAKGLAGAPIEPIMVDEAGSTTKVVQDFRALVDRQDAAAIVGYVSSGNCLAVAPVAEELKALTVFFDCGTPRIFEDAAYKYVFRSSATATIDSVAAARYVKAKFPDKSVYAGMNQNYAWGQDSWRDFVGAMKALNPSSRVTTEQFPKLFAGQYSAEISTLQASNSQIIHSSLWDGDLESFLFQASARGLTKNTLFVLTAGEANMFRLGAKMPDGVILGGRGPYGLFAADTPLNQWLRKAYFDRYYVAPTYPVYHMAQALLALKIGYDKAGAANGGKMPSKDQIVAAMEHMEFEAFGTTVKFALGKGHQAITGHAYGIYKFDKATAEPTFTDVIHFAAECVNPPEGVKTADWLAGGMQGAKCK